MTLLIIIIILLVAFFIFRKNMTKPKTDTIICFTGGLGSGKSLLSVKQVKKCVRLQKNKVLKHNIFQFIKHPFNRKNRDIWSKKIDVFSNIPLRLSFKKWASKLTINHLLLVEKLPPRCVVFIDEVDTIASQFDYKQPNILDNFNEFMRLFRHYTLGGYLVCNTQSSENVNLWIRRRLNNITNLFGCRVYFGFIGVVKARTINISEDIKTVIDGNLESDYKNIIFFCNPFFKSYDTYVYCNRYKTVLSADFNSWGQYKTNCFLSVPKEKIKPLTNNNEEK